MKTELTVEQSRKLIELGIDYQMASTYISKISSDGSYYIQHIFTLADVIDLLPRDIGLEVNNKYGVERGTLCCRLTITSKYIVSYECTILDYKAKETIIEFNDSNLIDSLYCMVVWCIENGYIKTETK